MDTLAQPYSHRRPALSRANNMELECQNYAALGRIAKGEYAKIGPSLYNEIARGNGTAIIVQLKTGHCGLINIFIDLVSIFFFFGKHCGNDLLSFVKLFKLYHSLSQIVSSFYSGQI